MDRSVEEADCLSNKGIVDNCLVGGTGSRLLLRGRGGDELHGDSSADRLLHDLLDSIGIGLDEARGRSSRVDQSEPKSITPAFLELELLDQCIIGGPLGGMLDDSLPDRSRIGLFRAVRGSALR